MTQILPVLFPGLLLLLASPFPPLGQPPGFISRVSFSLIPQDDSAPGMGPPHSGILQDADRIDINNLICYVSPLFTLPLEQLQQPFLSTYHVPDSSYILFLTLIEVLTSERLNNLSNVTQQGGGRVISISPSSARFRCPVQSQHSVGVTPALLA